MITIRTAKNKYRFINTDALKVKAFNASIAGLALYGIVTLITK